MLYLLSFARRSRNPFTMIDALIVVLIMAITTAAIIPLVGVASNSAKSVVILQDLQTLRSQIERYRLEHGGEVPLLFRGRFPQLEQATNASGVPGPAGRYYPFGPYLPQGVPVNPYTQSREVRLTKEFPPTKTTGSGWLYHQATGRIAADVQEFLNQ